MSSAASVPSTVAWYLRPVVTSVTVILLEPWITWLLVSTTPEELSTMPVPAAVPSW
jgi:hypothetical protein